MYKFLFGIMALLVIQPTFANVDHPKSSLDKISFTVSAKQWVQTNSAKVTVNINATLSQTNLVKARSEIMGQLNQIAKGDWHLTSFNRGQDNSGLEKLNVQAEIRINQNQLTDLYKNAKAVSKPGMKYEIGSIEFKPSLKEIESVKNDLRSKLYAQVNQELDNINKAYPGQSYSVNNIVFIDGDSPQPMKQSKNREYLSLAAVQSSAAELSVSDSLIMTAMVEVASNRQGK